MKTSKKRSKPAVLDKEGIVEAEGVVIECLPSALFQIQLDNGHIILGHLSGKMRKNFIKVTTGDTVAMELSPYDLTKARITYRYKDTIIDEES